MANLNAWAECCGASIISYVRDTAPEDCLRMVGHQVYARTFFAWIDAVTENRFETAGGNRLRKYIKEHKLGQVTVTPDWHLNRAHGPNSLKVYIWRPDIKAMKEWLEVNQVVNQQAVRGF